MRFPCGEAHMLSAFHMCSASFSLFFHETGLEACAFQLCYDLFQGSLQIAHRLNPRKLW